MYLWNTDALVENLRTGRVSQHEKMKYLAAFAVLCSCAFDASWWCHDSSGGEESYSKLILDGTFMTAELAITIGGVLLCYNANRKSDDSEFIDRFVCINCPVTIRLIALLLGLVLLYIGSGFFVQGEAFEPFPQNDFVDHGITIIFEVIFFWRVRHHLLRISNFAAGPTSLSSSVSV